MVSGLLKQTNLCKFLHTMICKYLKYKIFLRLARPVSDELFMISGLFGRGPWSVSYTHLDVYKRQDLLSAPAETWHEKARRPNQGSAAAWLASTWPSNVLEASQPGTSGTLIGSWHTTCQGIKRAPLEFLAHSIGRLEDSRKKRKKEEWRAQESQWWKSTGTAAGSTYRCWKKRTAVRPEQRTQPPNITARLGRRTQMI